MNAKDPRLSQIDPIALARRTEAMVINQIAALGASVRPLAAIHRAGEGSPLRTPLGRAVASLVRYAQTGSPGPRAGNFAPLEAMAVICRAVCGRAVDPGEDRLEILYRIKPGDLPGDLRTVLLAALGRYRLKQGEGVTAEELAALSERSPITIRWLIRRGDLPAEGSRPRIVPAGVAAAFLAARGVPGFTVQLSSRSAASSGAVSVP